jgi:DNA-binding IclR family transcriptional regulator
MTRPGPSAPGRQAPIVGVRQPPARTLPNLTAARTLRSLELLVFHPASAPGLAATMGIHDRTARRLLYSLEDEGYVQPGHGTSRQRHTYSPTPRLLALAGQLAARMPLITHGTHAVHQLNHATGLDAYLVVPSYGDVIVLARAGEHAPALWSLLPATDSAGGSVLLAYRQSWRDAQRPDDDRTAIRDPEARAAEGRRDGYAVDTRGNMTSLAVPVPMHPAPLAALVISSAIPALGDDGHKGVLAVLRNAAQDLSDALPPTRARRT